MTALLLHNGKIACLDVDAPSRFASALFIDKGRVIEVGESAALLSKHKGGLNSSQILDLDGATVIPGLIDSHLHVIREGMNFNMELRWDGVTSLKEGLQMIKEQAKRTPKGQWVRVVGGWVEHQFIEKRLPTVAELDEAGGGCPVFVLHLYDCAIVNTVGLQILGFNKDTPNPPAGEIQRDSAGNPTGILIARPNAMLLYSTLNKLPKLSHSDQLASTKAYVHELNRFGVTSCIDPGGGFQNFPDDYSVIQELDKQKELNVRIDYSLFPQKPKQELQDFKRWVGMVKPGDGSPFLKHLGAGEMLAFSAADFEDFKEARPDLPKEMESEMDAIVRFLVSHKWPFRLHATYGESIERDLAVFEAIAKENPVFKELRWFIDHAETISQNDINRIKALGGGIAIQHRMAFQGEYFIERYGQKAAEVAPPIAQMVQSGIHLGGGTDGTRVATYNPWVSLYWLVSGKTVGGTQLYSSTASPRNKVSRHDALALWTCDNAWFCRAESERGRLASGYFADLTVLSKDFFECPEEDIKSIESILTILDGKIVYTDGRWRTNTSIKQPAPIQISPAWSPVSFVGGYQLKGSAAWIVSRAEGIEDHSSSSVSSISSRGGGPQAKPTVNPAEFFIYGHDC